MASDITYHRLKYSALLWVALGFCIFAVVGWYSARMTNDFPSYDEGRGKDRLATREKVDQTENALLHPVDDKGKPTAAWVDQDKGLIQIPIDEAMANEVTDLQKVTVGEGAVIPGSTPAPAPAAAAPAAATPPASTNAAPAVAKPAAPAKPKPKKKPVSEPTGPTPPTTSIITPGTINQPVFNVRKVKAAPGMSFEGFITYGAQIDPSSGNIVMKASITGTN